MASVVEHEYFIFALMRFLKMEHLILEEFVGL